MTVFRTKRMTLASFIHATDALSFLRAELDTENESRTVFVFLDEGTRGPQLEIDFDRGATAPANALFRSQTFFRKQISSIKGETNSNYFLKHGDYNGNYSSRYSR